MKSKKIISITTEGLTYQDKEGHTGFINFEECKKNFSKWLQEENELTDEETNELEKRTRCVAVRDAFEDPKYIEFFTVPRVRFEFFKSLFKDDYKEFRALDFKIKEVGWKTFDLG
jgi:hypothetical protein